MLTLHADVVSKSYRPPALLVRDHYNTVIYKNHNEKATSYGQDHSPCLGVWSLYVRFSRQVTGLAYSCTFDVR